MDFWDDAAAAWRDVDVADDVREHARAHLRRWATDARHADDRPQLEALVARGAYDELLDAFGRTLPFGTGGRRGPVGLGPNRLNPWTFATSVQGHAEMLRERRPGTTPLVVVAFDVRVFHDLRGVYRSDLPLSVRGISSRDFARLGAEVYAANGVDVLMVDPGGELLMSTPELSAAIRRHGAQGGLNVSASHNPPDDNGGKVYNAQGAQDTPPDDEELSRRVEAITDVARVPFDEALADGRVALLDAEAENAAYVELVLRGALSEPSARPVVFTNLHGAGAFTCRRVLAARGFDVHDVPSQAPLDGAFPGVPFASPNPELPAVYADARARADEVGADLILATDPDADRIGMEVRGEHGWCFVTGDEILCLVADHVLSRRAELGRLPDDAYLLTTLVTTRLLGRIARSYGCRVVEDLLTGFKWMAEVVDALERRGVWRDLEACHDGFVLAGEESHGVLLTHELRDKDGAGAALALAELDADLRRRGSDPLRHLDLLARRHGVVETGLVNTVMTGASGVATMRAIQDALRADPPGEIGGVEVTGVEDLTDTSGWRGPHRSGTDRAARDVLVFHLAGGRRVVLRPSGTEPKNKLYVEACGPRPDPGELLSDDELAAHRRAARADVARLGAAFQRTMLARGGVVLPDHAFATSPLLSVDERRRFVDELLPWIAGHAGRDDFARALDDELSTWRKNAAELLAPGVEAWLPSVGLAPPAEDAVRAAFGLPPRGDAD